MTQIVFSKPPFVLPRGCKLIYCPRGRAEEYAQWAINIYRGCGHGCTYCFGPSVLRMTRAEFHNSPRQRSAGFLKQLEKEVRLCQAVGLKGRVLMCFTTDPYQPINKRLELARKTIQLLHSAGLNVQVLTKAGTNSLADIDLFTPDDAYAASLTFADTWEGARMSRQWEPRAAPPESRLAALRAFHAAGVPTWGSLEPVISPEQTKIVVEQSYAYTDVYKAGTLNYHAHAKTIDWPAYADMIVDLLESTGRPFYIKNDLAKYHGKSHGFWSGGPFCTCGTGDATELSEHDPLCLLNEVVRCAG